MQLFKTSRIISILSTSAPLAFQSTSSAYRIVRLLANPPRNAVSSSQPLPAGLTPARLLYQSSLLCATRTGKLSRDPVAAAHQLSGCIKPFRSMQLAARRNRSHAAVAGRFAALSRIRRCPAKSLCGDRELEETIVSEISQRGLRRASASSAVPCFTVVTNQPSACKRRPPAQTLHRAQPRMNTG